LQSEGNNLLERLERSDRFIAYQNFFTRCFASSTKKLLLVVSLLSCSLVNPLAVDVTYILNTIDDEFTLSSEAYSKYEVRITREVGASKD